MAARSVPVGRGATRGGLTAAASGAPARLLGTTVVQRPQRGRGAGPVLPHEACVVVVGDRAGPVIELEFLQRGQGSVSLLAQPEALPLGPAQRVDVVGPRRLPEQRQRDRQDGGEGHEREEHDWQRVADGYTSPATGSSA